MSDQKNQKSVPSGTKGKAAPDVSDDKMVQEDADEMAEQGRDEEERFDEDHGIFTK